MHPPPSRLVLTDGEAELLPLLTANCASNGYPCDESPQALAFLRSAATVTVTAAALGGGSAVSVACAKLWWGDAADTAVVAAMATIARSGQPQLYDVILGADLVYSTDQVGHEPMRGSLVKKTAHGSCSLLHHFISWTVSRRRCRCHRSLRRSAGCSLRRVASILRYLFFAP